jgi:hypothetical protein
MADVSNRDQEEAGRWGHNGRCGGLVRHTHPTGSKTAALMPAEIAVENGQLRWESRT